MDNEKNNNFIAILLTIVILVVVGCILYIIINNNSTKTTEEKIENVQNTNQESTITQEEVATFIDNAVTDGYNLFSDTDTDRDVFILILKYLTYGKVYEKIGEEYVFKQSDFIDIAQKYMMKDNFDYIIEDNGFTYDPTLKTFTSKLQFGLFGEFLPQVEKTIEDFNSTSTEATFTYKVKYDWSNIDIEVSQPSNYSYKIKVIKDSTGLKIKSVDVQ